MSISLPSSVRYVKNGRSHRWWNSAKTRNQVHLGWSSIPDDLLLNPDLKKIKVKLKQAFSGKRGYAQDFSALRDLLVNPEQHIWVTFEDGYLWWCTVKNGAVINPNGESVSEGHFWLKCDLPWSNRSIDGGKLLERSTLPGTVSKVSGFRATVCKPSAWQTILRIIKNEQNVEVKNSRHARKEYEEAIVSVIQQLTPFDFEQLIDLILNRTGWLRISRLGSVVEGVDIQAKNATADEIVFVQIKSVADQSTLLDYISRFKGRLEFHDRMIFAVHTSHGAFHLPKDLPQLQLWEEEKIAQLTVRLGLGEWVEDKVG